jgi:hypothetical protein
MKHDIRGLRLENDAWVYSYRIAGRARRMTIGHAPGLIPADARKAAQHFAGLVAIGRCPASERKAARPFSEPGGDFVQLSDESRGYEIAASHKIAHQAIYRQTIRDCSWGSSVEETSRLGRHGPVPARLRLAAFRHEPGDAFRRHPTRSK